MSYADERQAIETRFATAWTAGSNTTVKYENQKWEEPKGNNDYVALFIENLRADQIELRETALHRHTGMIYVNIYTKKFTGTGSARILGDEIAVIFRRATFDSGSPKTGTIICYSPHYEIVGEEQGRFVSRVSVPFYRDTSFTRPSS